MDDVNNKIVNFYTEGMSLARISRRTKTSLDYVKNLLEELKEDEDKLNFLVLERFLTLPNKREISKELDITVYRVNEILGDYKNVKIERGQVTKDEKESVKEIQWDDLDVCPSCLGEKVNRLSDTSYIYKKNRDNPMCDNRKSEDSYCMDCGTEWFFKDGKMYKVIWEYIK